jgi:hypothetical protein
MKDEIVRGEPMGPKIAKVEPLEDWKLHLTFENGEEGIFDMEPLRYGVFARLDDLAYFRRVRIVDGCIEWPHGQDLHYDMLYHESKPRKAVST